MSRRKLFTRWVADALRWSWQLLSKALGQRRALVRVVVSEGALSSDLKSKTLYIVTEEGVAWQAAIICPCGCGDKLDLNLLPDERPCWRVRIGPSGAASLHPSVWRTEGCRSHFFLRDGHITWVD